MNEDEIIERKKPNKQRELGMLADKKIVSELVDTISSKWILTDSLPSQPILLLVGGFQGSGKSTILNKLSSSQSMITISPDEIRFLLFQRIAFSDIFVHTVNSVRNKLICNAFKTGMHVAVDENSFPMRINLFTNLIGRNNYKVISAYLNCSEELLIKRVQYRQGQPGKYKGTVKELKVYLKAYGTPNLSHYDKVFNTDKKSIESIVKKLNEDIEALQHESI
ncbi:MAG TPA: AAA family ATPase [Candidatus Nitrosocosmicus sp.]|nr:AAA family ATPase [Candidatus Nitrosocosmicus sp.]